MGLLYLFLYCQQVISEKTLNFPASKYVHYYIRENGLRVLLWRLKILNYMTVLHVVASQASFTHYCMTKKNCGKREILSQNKLSGANSLSFFFNLR